MERTEFENARVKKRQKEGMKREENGETESGVAQKHRKQEKDRKT